MTKKDSVTCLILRWSWSTSISCHSSRSDYTLVQRRAPPRDSLGAASPHINALSQCYTCYAVYFCNTVTCLILPRRSTQQFNASCHSSPSDYTWYSTGILWYSNLSDQHTSATTAKPAHQIKHIMG